jgi:hypothetical protein
MSTHKYRVIVTFDPQVWAELMRHHLELNLQSENGAITKSATVNRIVGEHLHVAGADALPLKAAPQRAPRSRLRTAKSA